MVGIDLILSQNKIETLPFLDFCIISSYIFPDKVYDLYLNLNR
jgi:hypothetical protein